jgi:hypothetical protein
MIARLPAAAAPIAWRSLLVLAAGAAVIAELAFPWEQPAEMEPPSLTGPAALRHPGPPPPATYPAIAAHPLFSASRAPWVPAPEPPPEVAPAVLPPPNGYTLVGVVLSGGTRSAILKSTNATKTVTINEGEVLGGWALRSIDAAGLHFEASGQTFDLAFAAGRQGAR